MKKVVVVIDLVGDFDGDNVGMFDADMIEYIVGDIVGE